MKKYVISLLVIVLCFQFLQPLTANANEEDAAQINLVPVNGMGNEYTEEQSMEILQSIAVIESHITNKDGELVLDSKASELVEPFVYDHFARGISKINQEVREGSLTLDVAEHSVTAAIPAPADSKVVQQTEEGTYSVASLTDKYWWGTKWYLSESESKYWQEKLSGYALSWGVVAAISGILGAPQATVAAVIISAGNYYLYRELRDNRSAKGTMVVFKWTPPSVYAEAR